MSDRPRPGSPSGQALSFDGVSMSDAPPPRATRREWIGLAIIALPCMVYAMDLTVLNLALPAISTALQPSSSQLLWIVDIYGFLVAGFLITMGNLGDKIGRRKVLLIGAAAFGVASILAARAQSAEMLIFARAVLGIAGATLAPSTMSLIRNMFHDESQRQFAIGVWIASFSVGGAIGPLVGGVILQYFAWGTVFLVAVPVMAALLVLGPMLLPEYKDPNAGKLDPASVVLSLFAVLSTIYALKHLAEFGATARAFALLVLGLVLATIFVRRQSRLDYPLLDLKLFRVPRFSAAIAAYSLSCLAMFGVYIFITQYLQLVLGLTPLQAGFATAPWAMMFVIGSLLSPRLARSASPVSVMVWGLGVAAVGFLFLLLVGTEYGLAALIAGTVIMSVGLAPVFTLGNEMIITAAPPERAGAASALSETSAEFSGALGIAVFGSIGMAWYRQTLSSTMPAGVPEELRNEAMATLGGALAASQELPTETGNALVAAARAVFVDTLELSAVIAAVLLVIASVLSARILRSQA